MACTHGPVNRALMLEASPQRPLGLLSGAHDHTGSVATRTGRHGGDTKPVFLFNGDTHTFAKDKPLTNSKWLSFYGISGAASNLTRVTVEGETNVDEYVRVNVVSTPEVLQIQRVVFK